MHVDREHELVRILRQQTAIGQWSFAILRQRLLERHSETVFVAALTRGQGKDEHFHYRTVTYSASPSIQTLIELIECGDVILEHRMHVKPTDGAKNHGPAFRVRKHRLVDLFQVQQLCRPRTKAE